MRRLVTSLSPNAERDDIHLAASLLIQPWKWQRGSAIADLEQAVGNFFRSHTLTFESGRSALCAAIQALNLPKKSEILLQAFTCIAVPNSIRWANCIPLYVDVDPKTYTMDTSTLETLITPNTRAILIQHTFGIPADMNAIMAIAHKHRLFVIEDCAHSFGSRWNGQLLGTFGDVAIFSFGRDKSLSSVFGGMALSRNSEILTRLKELQAQAPLPSKTWIIRQLLHPIILSISLKTYDTLSFGKIFLEITKRLHFISKAFEPQERQGGRPSWANRQMANALAILALHQWKKRERFDAHRRHLSELYRTELNIPDMTHPILPSQAEPALLRYPLSTPHRDKILDACKQARLELGDWYVAPIAPKGIDEQAAGYDRTKTPNAVSLSQKMINLPTHINISEADAKKIIKTIKYALH